MPLSPSDGDSPRLGATPSQRVVVIDEAGVHGLALVEALAKAGYAARLVRSSRDAPTDTAIVAVVSDATDDVARLRVHAGRRAPLVAVLRHPSTGGHLKAVTAGADGAVGCDSSPREFVRSMHAAVSASLRR